MQQDDKQDKIHFSKRAALLGLVSYLLVIWIVYLLI